MLTERAVYKERAVKLLTERAVYEVYKAGGLPVTQKLTKLFQYMWRKKAILQDFKDASIIQLYKQKEEILKSVTTTEVFRLQIYLLEDDKNALRFTNGV